ncbi:MAG: acyltransferase [Cyclobacteriaceae bacterium]|nr:acyltransferase [Cyclobacteriaceae bacterium]
MKKHLRDFYFKLLYLINTMVLRINRVKFGTLDIRGILLVNNAGAIRIAPHAIINSSKYKNIIGGDTRSSIVVKRGANLLIGSNFRMSNSAIYCAESISVGNNVMIGGSCRIWDTDFHPLNPSDRSDNPNEGYKTRPITIGDNVFIGGFSIILKGTIIGNGAIIGAGSVVSGTIPAGEIWAGNPARFIKKTG